MGKPESKRQPRNSRVDGSTAERQVAFLDELSRNRCVSKAAAAVGMSRESAYRLRERRNGALFAALWDRAVGFAPGESHNPPLTNGQIMRLLGNHYRRQNNGFWPKRRRGSGNVANPHRTSPL